LNFKNSKKLILAKRLAGLRVFFFFSLKNARFLTFHILAYFVKAVKGKIDTSFGQIDTSFCLTFWDYSIKIQA